MMKNINILFLVLSLFNLQYVFAQDDKVPVEEEVYNVVEIMPEYPGGQKAMFEFIVNNMEYPVKAREKGVEGVVYVNFVINKTGAVTKAKVMRGIGSGCDEEALRVVNAMPDWNPGLQRGKPVNVSFNLPVKFKVR